jgi:S-adenosylmethionine synthetase
MQNYYFTSESVTEGHPDKLCDQLSDALLDAYLARDPYSRVAIEVCASAGILLITGEVTSRSYVDIQDIVKRTIQRIGYTDPSFGFDADSIPLHISLNHQSSDIALGVEKDGAGDQGMVFGFATDETDEYMPMPIYLAHRLTRQLAQVRKDGTLPYLRPDGKSQVTVKYEDGKPVQIDTVVISAQHAPEVSQDKIKRDIIKHVICAAIPDRLLDENTKYLINPTGRFAVGGPSADTGLTGRKIIVDTYGSFARHGGGAFSGKDATKVDRSAAYAARHIAKNLVAAGFAKRLEIQVSYAIGVAAPVSLSVDTFGTGKAADATILEIIGRHFDLRPSAIINRFGLRRPIFTQTAAYGHFGRGDLELPWERLDMVDTLRSELSDNN